MPESFSFQGFLRCSVRIILYCLSLPLSIRLPPENTTSTTGKYSAAGLPKDVLSAALPRKAYGSGQEAAYAEAVACIKTFSLVLSAVFCVAGGHGSGLPYYGRHDRVVVPYGVRSSFRLSFGIRGFHPLSAVKLSRMLLSSLYHAVPWNSPRGKSSSDHPLGKST